MIYPRSRYIYLLSSGAWFQSPVLPNSTLLPLNTTFRSISFTPVTVGRLKNSETMSEDELCLLSIQEQRTERGDVCRCSPAAKQRQFLYAASLANVS